MTKAPWHSRFALILALLLPLYFALAALGTKFGLWGWRTGLLTLTIQTGPILMGVVALAALISLIVVLLRKPRKGWLLSLIALLVPVGIFAGLGHIRSQAADIPPIHDIATDTTVPPTFSQRVLDLRSETKANPLNDYSVPIGEFAMWSDSPAPLAEQSHAQIIAASYPDLAPLPLGDAAPQDAIEAIVAAMEEMGFTTELKELFHFMYKAPFDNGLTEHEFDHVMVGYFEEEPNINPEEVADWKWMHPEDIKNDMMEYYSLYEPVTRSDRIRRFNDPEYNLYARRNPC